jgi:hypothetical protein
MTDHHDFGDHFGDHHDVPADPHELDGAGPDPYLPDDHDGWIIHDDAGDHVADQVADHAGDHHDEPAAVEHHHSPPPDDHPAGDDHPAAGHTDDPDPGPDDVFPPAVDVGDLPEPIDGFPWIDTATLGPVDPRELAEYAAVDLPEGADPWTVLAAAEDPATSALARFWEDGTD